MERFWSKVKKTRGCWIWIGFVDALGYGKFRIGRKVENAHRVAYEIFKGPIKKGLIVCHSCDNPSCVNPKHLWIGTHRDNKMDCVSKGRAYIGGTPPRLFGNKHPNSILTSKQIREIKRIYTGKYGEQTALGKKFGVCRTTIGKIVNGINWRHI